MVLLADIYMTGAVEISEDKPIGFCSEGQAFVCCCVSKAARLGWALVVSVEQLFGGTSNTCTSSVETFSTDGISEQCSCLACTGSKKDFGL